jgi:uncharacterized protein with GYD domain
MQTYVMLTRLSPEALVSPDSVEALNRRLQERLRAECPGVRWVADYALLGPYDCLDIFEAPDQETATKVCLLVRSIGHATTETWMATPGEGFRALAAGMKSIRVSRLRGSGTS